eukprot:2326222-Pyramimonas_sp.AAC.1
MVGTVGTVRHWWDTGEEGGHSGGGSGDSETVVGTEGTEGQQRRGDTGTVVGTVGQWWGRCGGVSGKGGGED